MGSARAATEAGGSGRRIQLKPHQQIVVVSIAALVALGTLAGVMAARIGAIDQSHSQVANHAAPIADALTNAELLYQADIAQSTELIGALSTAQRATIISELTGKTRLADQAWATYKRLVANDPRDATLQATAEAAEAQQIRLIAPALAGKAIAADTSQALARQFDAQLGAIETLRARYAGREAAADAVLTKRIDRGRRDLNLTAAALFAFLLLAFGAVYTSVRRRDRQVRASEIERAVESDRNNLETRLTRSLEMVHAEDAVYPRVTRALAETIASRSSEMLLASSSHSRLRQMVALGAAETGGGCSVGNPGDCPAIDRGQTQVFAHSDALDACPFLDGRPDGACSAACVPVSIGSKTVGVVHVTAKPGTAPDPETVARLEIVARKAGDRIGMLRAFSRSEVEAHTDQLTGLMNRRSLEDDVHRIIESGLAYTVAYGDLDHFKQINDVYGHDAGDRALRVFSRVLRDSVRPNDIPARYGGEEFVVVLPECSVADATQVLERVRENLARAQVTASSPPCTVSFGLASSEAGREFNDVLKIADRALAQAKDQGRDRIVVSSPLTAA